MYDAFSSDYDRFVNWQNRLAYEMPFIEQQLHNLPMPASGVPLVLDAACGTGMHAIALAQQGYAAAGADLSPGMIGRARANAELAGVQVEWEVAGFGDLARVFGDKPGFPFDAVLCLGNSLPHALTSDELNNALSDFAACLRPEGLLLIQSRNFDAVLQKQERWMEPQPFREGDREWLFMRFYDFLPDGLIDFNILTFQREGEGSWQQQIITTRLRPITQAEIINALEVAGFHSIQSFGDMTGAAFNPDNSGNLIVTARKA